MAHSAHSREVQRVRSSALAAIVVIALSSVLVARNLPPEFPSHPSAHSAVSASCHHDQRPRFDHNGSHSSAPSDAFVPCPPPAEAQPASVNSVPLFSLLAKGFQFNRPPPAN
jgi:hypothetical protein